MVREEPLKLHNNAIEYLLAVRGAKQIQSDVGLCLYRMANHRFQVRQLGLGLGHLPVQLACIEMLDVPTPRYGLSKMQLEAQKALALSQDLDSFHWEELSHLISQIQMNLDEYEQWKTCLPESWVPKRIRLADHSEVLQVRIPNQHPEVRLNKMPCDVIVSTLKQKLGMSGSALLIDASGNHVTLADLNMVRKYRLGNYIRAKGEAADSAPPS